MPSDPQPAPPRRHPVRAAALAAGWVAVTAGVAGAAWFAVGAAGDGLGPGERVLSTEQVRARLADLPSPTGSPSEAAAPTAEPSSPTPATERPAGTEPSDAGPSAPGAVTSSPTGSGGSRPTAAPARSTSAPPPLPVLTAAVATSGGTAAASCQGAVVSLRYATPRDGWTVAVQDRGPEKVEVVFSRARDGGSGGSSGRGSDGSSGDHGGGDHGGGSQTTAKAVCEGGTPAWETEQH